MNVYQKIQKCRRELKSLPIKESGNNKFAQYTYMELGDFLPHIVDLCDAHGLCTVISFRDTATLTIINSDKPEESVVFESPMSTASLKGCHEIQNLGAVETYLRRYLYVAAFDIVEHDALDSTQGKESAGQSTKQAPQPVKNEAATITEKQEIELKDLIGQSSSFTVEAFCRQAGIKKISDLEASRFKGAFGHVQTQIAKELEPA